MINRDEIRYRYNIALLTLIVIYVFIIGLMEATPLRGYIYGIVITAIYVLAVLTIQFRKKGVIVMVIGVILLSWVSELLDFMTLSFISDIVSFLFFVYVIVYLVARVAGSKSVGKLEFLESINVYFLIAMAGSILFNVINTSIPDAFNRAGEALYTRSDLIYYTLVTFTTLGYGDITPADPLAKSLSILMSVSGQLYLTMIIALLVGKYLSDKSTQTDK